MSGFEPQVLKAAVRQLSSDDPRMAAVVKKVGVPTIKVRRLRFATLVSSILSQQISGAAARTIHGRLKGRLGRFTAERVAQLSIEEYRELGVSKQKASYLLDLAAKAADGTLRFSRHTRMDDQQIIDELVQVKGIGVWTAQMYLIFSLARADVFPVDDLGVRNGLRKIYELTDDSDRKRLHEIAASWSPYRSIGAWYCWQSLELDS